MIKLSYCSKKYIIDRAKRRGSSLILAMIFSFVVLVTVSSLVYVVRYNLLSVKSLVSQEAIITAEQQYIQGIVDKKSIKLGENKIGNYTFENTLESEQPIFSNKNINVELFQGHPSAISSDIVHKLIYRKKLKVTKDIIYKKLPKQSMINYDSKFVPINIPYVDISRMSEAEKFYHLNSSGQISDKKHGFVGFIDKEYNWILISVNGHTQVISLKDLSFSKDYQISIGWQLVKGRWQMLMAIYDKKHVYIFKTSLNDLVNNFSKAVLDLSTSIDIIDPPPNVAAISWYFPKNNTELGLVILATRYDSYGKLTVVVEDLEYDKIRNVYKASIRDTIGGLGKVENNVYAISLDPSYTFSQGPLFIFAGNKMLVYSISRFHKVKRATVILNNNIVNKPLIIKKDKYSYYVIVYSQDRYYQYTYTINTRVLNKSDPVVYNEQEIQDLIVRYGLKFIVTKKNMYIDNFQNEQLSKVLI